MAIEQRARIREGMVEVRLTYVGGNGEIWSLPSYMFYIGDVNPFEHGGTLYIEEDTSIRFLSFRPNEEEEGLVYVADGIVDMDDFTNGWIDLVDVIEYADIKVLPSDKEGIYDNRYELADGCISYYGVENFGGSWGNYTHEEVAEMMKSFYGYSIEIV